MRKYYIDNLRWLCVLLLFPYHTFMVYNAFGESFYIKGPDIASVSKVIIGIYPWIMPLLFVIAGASSMYALKARPPREYIKERISKLLVPLLFGILLLVPMQTYFAEVFHNQYAGGYLQQYALFFTKPTDLSGYHGGFTPAHLWFLLYLFVISFVCLPIMWRYQKSKKKPAVHKIPLPALLGMFIIPVFSQAILDIGGKSVGEYLTYFLFGYFIISDDMVQGKLEKYRFVLLGLALLGLIPYTLWGLKLEARSVALFELLYSFSAWTAVLAALGLGKRYLSFHNKWTEYLSRASFSIYVFHQQWIVLAAYFALMWVKNIPLQMVFIIAVSTICTFLSYAVLKRVSVARLMFGMKK